MRTQLLGLFIWPLALSAQANADLLGSTLSWQYYVYGGAYTEGSNHGTFVVNGGVGGTFWSYDIYYFNIVADESSITFDYSIASVTGFWEPSPLSLPPTIHNGIAIDMVSGPAFAAVTVNPATNMPGFDASRISFTESQIQVDWQELTFSPNTIVKLDIVTIPAPPGLALFSLLAIAPRRKRR